MKCASKKRMVFAIHVRTAKRKRVFTIANQVTIEFTADNGNFCCLNFIGHSRRVYMGYTVGANLANIEQYIA